MGRRVFARRTVIVASVVVAAVPALRMIIFLLGTGENCIHDDAAFAARFVNLVDSGEMDLRSCFRWCYFGGHFLMFPLLVQLVVARIADLNEYVLLSIGWLSNLVRCLLLFDLFTPRRDGLLRWVFLPLLATLVFLPSQIALYSFGFPSLQFFFSHLGFTAGLWVLLRCRLSTFSVCVVSCCGIFASWSSAIGVLCWPIFACSLLLLGHRALRSWVITVSAGIISIAPYVYFVVLAPPPNQRLEALPQFPSLSSFAAELGWAFFRSGPPVLEAVGLSGLFVMAVGASLYFRMRRDELAPPSARRVLAAFNLIAFGLLCAYQIAAYRGGLGAHRSAQFLSFWIGLSALAYIMFEWWWQHDSGRPRQSSWRVASIAWWSAATSVGIAVCALLAWDFDSYVHFLRARTPASAACLRSFRTAPTLCRDQLLLGELHSLDDFYRLGRIVERSGLSVFGRHRRLTMQGDVILGSVGVRGVAAAQGARWIEGRRAADRRPWWSYHRLNLLLNSRETVDWSISVPLGTVRAELRTAVALAADPSTKTHEATACVQLVSRESAAVPCATTVSVTDDGGWTRIRLPLEGPHGVEMTVRLSAVADPGANAAELVFKYPHVALEVDPHVPPARSRQEPSNTDLSPSFPSAGERDLCFDLADPRRWTAHDLMPAHTSPERGSQLVITGPSPLIRSRGNLAVALQDFRHVVIRFQDQPVGITDLGLGFRFSSGPSRHVNVPLSSKGAIRAYSYDLRLLEAPSSQLDGITVSLRTNGGDSPLKVATVSSLCLEQSRTQ